jgi:hypothetical protein
VSLLVSIKSKLEEDCMSEPASSKSDDHLYRRLEAVTTKATECIIEITAIKLEIERVKKQPHLIRVK